MTKQGLLTLVLAAFLAATLAFAANPQPQRIERNGYGLEIRYEPIPGVPLHPTTQAPIPVEPTILGATAISPTGEPEPAVQPTEASNPTPGPTALRLPPAANRYVQSAACGLQSAVRSAGIAAAPGKHESRQDGLPDLVFYTPTGWDFPIVPSNVKGTHTVGPDLNDGDSTYFDFAVINQGSAMAQPRFYTYLYWDGLVFAGFYADSLPVGYYAYYNDYGFRVPAGTHLIAGFTDSTNVIAESLENNNRWSNSWTWRNSGTALPNLRPYTPSGWDFPIVPSDVRNTRTVGPDLNDLDTTFVDWAVLNDGNAMAQPRFYVYLYLDNEPIAGWSVDSLPYMHYVHADDDPEFVPAGTHALGIFADSTNTVQESNENDNTWSNSWTWRHDAATLANLAAFLPNGWDFPIVPSNVPGTNTVGPDLNDQDTTYIDLAFANLGNYTAKPRFYVYLYWVTTPIAGWYLDSLKPMTYLPIEDQPFLLPAGTHSLGYVLDSLNAVAESNESDNHYANSYVWRHVGIADLMPYAPSGWDFPIVPSNVRATHTVGPDLNDQDTTFIDWAVANVGSATALPQFFTYLYLDNVPIAGFYVDSLPSLTYAAVSDFAQMVAQGTHNLMSFADSFNVVPESSKSNNRFAHDFSWRHVFTAMPNLLPYAPSGWDFPIVPSNVRGTHTVGPDLNDVDTTFIDFAFANNGRATAQPLFYIYLYSDSIPFAGFFADSLQAGYYASASDIPEFFTYGNHELGIFVDSTNTVAESSETDNKWFHTFTWSHQSGIEAPTGVASRFGLTLGANPIDRSSDISYSLPVAEQATLAVYDRNGRLVTLLAHGTQGAGTHVARWNSDRLAAGVYVIRLETGTGERRVKTVVKL